MSSLDSDLWLQAWQDDHICDFHQLRVNRLLMKHWPLLHMARGERVMVPLCGKSLDMLWLAQQGYEVLGIELSALAVAAFFEENGLQPTHRKLGDFTLWQSGRVSILCGDFFDLTPLLCENVDWVYDRAALTALPEPLRRRYAAYIQQLTPANIVLMTIEEQEDGVSEACFLGIDPEIMALYGPLCHIGLSYVGREEEIDPNNPLGKPISVAYKIYQITR
ncbi:Thiopurine S-methyltransferase [Magnetococcus marinus MC-1]|uniref:Thiopurine S-methyltransferase n=1 Tax=Magnetococcus marinus (strain ATCC BAA-1437 / JCM 17883 / MC-1) TaxID=156889 RepID=A0L4Z7_MAGMM|nr:thiopurine S-methyltransferase [Magnetococcus marinus]ABK43040.1 Thiopurine S-methyltransferase [Magnetococcus marinus MC-1]